MDLSTYYTGGPGHECSMHVIYVARRPDHKLVIQSYRRSRDGQLARSGSTLEPLNKNPEVKIKAFYDLNFLSPESASSTFRVNPTSPEP